MQSNPQSGSPPALARRSSARILQIGLRPGDDAETRLNKSLLTASTMLMASLAVVWGALYLGFGEPLSAVIPWSYALGSGLSLWSFSVTGTYRRFAFSQLLLSLVLPAALAFSLGNFTASSGVIAWSLTCPLGALLFVNRRQSVAWFLAFLGLVILYWLMLPMLRAENGLSAGARDLLFVMNIAGVSVFAFSLTYYFAVQRIAIQSELETERGKSERLLRNVLPAEVAEHLKSTSQIIAASYGSASVLFADIVGFSAMAHDRGPEETVRYLNRAHSHFDALTDAHGVEKIRTIGDGYMVAAGVPAPSDDHAGDLARTALDMLAYAQSASGPDAIILRIGISSGPLVAGVIGQRKFCYDVWGETVNLASRLERTGAPGRIQVSAQTRALLGTDFVFESRGVQNLKGVGRVDCFWLTGRAKAGG